MRVLFIPWSQPTHYMPMVTLAWALRSAGHEVRVAAQPHVVNAVKASGLTVAAVGRDYDYLPEFQQVTNELARHNRENPPVGSFPVGPPDLPAEVLKPILEAKFAPFVKTATAMASDLVPMVRAWRPDVVIANPFAMVAPLVAEIAKVPLIHHLTGPTVERMLGLFPGNSARPELWADDLRTLFERSRVEVREEYASAAVDPCPGSLQFAGIPARMPIRFVPYNGPGDIPDWLAEPVGRRRICVTWGTTTTELTGPEGFLVPAILKSLANLDVEVAVTVKASDRALLGDIPANVRVVDQLPLHLLLPHCDAIVHQGGTGTMLTAASLGLPQVLVAGIQDQLVTAAQVAGVGAGIALNAASTGADAIASAVTRVLSDDDVALAARQLQAEIAAQPTPAEVARSVERLVG
ncbi:nucleotide disphospho-sugar-binding domain-containing protein [Streptomyces sp. NPDC048516]|uniref:nucleotide disphospho-sugar-binding domain-containing protein n=1 Tax=Streptomyces sp. NPDC048516 TaxID=3365565 RepID=UPI003722FA53